MKNEAIFILLEVKKMDNRHEEKCIVKIRIQLKYLKVRKIYTRKKMINYYRFEKFKFNIQHFHETRFIIINIIRRKR